ncbi:bacteriophage Gp15 family protein [uncultured Clostridium sp.]|uniref:bacteriophage Gp15 family protein n=1 Tax=uncultured Clostridium sp. TaxID=59620 RepID=UPI0026357EAF|nr:bacteriophage Gp15 family protein [uncultured Clostridium sp.]
MNILIDSLPKTIRIDNENYEINSDFRTYILFELLMQDIEIKDEEKLIQALQLCYIKCPHNIQEGINKMLWFYSCGKESDLNYSNKISSTTKQIYDFDYDAEYIYSAFLDQYGIDLNDIEYLHWWKFKAMFKSLKEDNEIVKIMGYRSIDLSKIEDKQQKNFYKRMKKIHNIPKEKNERKMLNKIEEVLLNGGDLSTIL